MRIRDAAKVGTDQASAPNGDAKGSEQVQAFAKVFDDAAKADAAHEKSTRRVQDKKQMKIKSRRRISDTKKPDNKLALLQKKVATLEKKVADAKEENEKLLTAYNDVQQQFEVSNRENTETIQSLNKTINELKTRYTGVQEVTMEYDPETDVFRVGSEQVECPFDEVKTTFEYILKLFPEKKVTLSIKGQEGEKTMEEIKDSRKVQDSEDKPGLPEFAALLDKYLGGEATFEELKEFPTVDLPQEAQEVAAQLTANDGYLPQEAADEILPAFKTVLSEASIQVHNLALITDSFDASQLLERLKAARVIDSVLSTIEAQIPGTPSSFKFSRVQSQNSIKVKDDLYLLY